ncbi:hypothetical protein EYF80_018232 [Liparis tanakae]|uniref:Uncharacterized protein n=1 Tax=Liparis tanakae TaxID=230148 RepID=A0A4Z2I0H8_9TELE|nr:hypothetical protein EYF80_018232 [Liparis tanakae]
MSKLLGTELSHQGRCSVTVSRPALQQRKQRLADATNPARGPRLLKVSIRQEELNCDDEDFFCQPVQLQLRQPQQLSDVAVEPSYLPLYNEDGDGKHNEGERAVYRVVRAHVDWRQTINRVRVLPFSHLIDENPAGLTWERSQLDGEEELEDMDVDPARQIRLDITRVTETCRVNEQ